MASCSRLPWKLKASRAGLLAGLTTTSSASPGQLLLKVVTTTYCRLAGPGL